MKHHACVSRECQHYVTALSSGVTKNDNCLSMQRQWLIALLLCLTAVIGTFGSRAGAEEGGGTLTISEGESWQYVEGGEEPPFKWTYLNFDSSGWNEGQTGFGYGSPAFRTHLNDMKGRYQTVYTRHEFVIHNPMNVTAMSIHITCDGPFAAFINGIEVIANSEPVDEDLDISGFSDILIAGKNMLAVQCTNDDLNSDDYFFVPSFRMHED